MKRENIVFTILILISSLGFASTDLYLPSLPAIAKTFNASFQSVKLTISVYMMGFAIAPLIYGPLSDGIGRRKPLITGLILGLLGCFLCFSAKSINFLLFGRLLQGIGAGSGTSLFRAILRDLFSGDKLAQYGSYVAIVTIGVLAAAPIVGGYMQAYLGWRSNFILLFMLTFIALLSVLFLVPETNKFLQPEYLKLKKIVENFVILITSRTFITFTLINFLTYGAIFAWITSGPVLLQHNIGLTPVEFGWVYPIPGLTFALGAYLNGKLIFRYGTQRMLQFGMAIMLAAGLLMLALWALGYMNWIVIIVPAMLLLFAVPIVLNNSFASAFHPFPHIAGMAGALFGTLTSLGGALSSSVLAFAPDKNQVPMAVVLISCALLSFCSYYFTPKASVAKTIE